MSKRFADTDKYKKPFLRALPAAYKLLWDYICLDCNHAGIWHVDFAIARIYLGDDAPVTESEALYIFNADEKRILEFDGGKKWLILPFIDFQYGRLNPANRVHASVIFELEKAGFEYDPSKGLISPFQGAKDKEYFINKENQLKAVNTGACNNNIEKKRHDYPADFEQFWQAYPKKTGKVAAAREWAKAKPDIAAVLSALVWQKKSLRWAKAGEDGQAMAYVPDPERYIKYRRFEDAPDAYGYKPAQNVRLAPKVPQAILEQEAERRRRAALTPEQKAQEDALDAQEVAKAKQMFKQAVQKAAGGSDD